MISGAILAVLTGLAQPADPPAVAAPPPATTWPALGETPGGRWLCDPEHERQRQEDLALLRADMVKGPTGAAPDLPRLQVALAHGPDAPIGGVVSCDDRTLGFNSPAALGAMMASARPGAPRMTVEPRPMPYAELALLVGSVQNAAGRGDLALAALDRGLAVEPQHPMLVAEKAFALNQMGRSGEAADICARAIAADQGATKPDLARLHRSRGYALGEMGRYDEAIAEYRSSQALDPAETASANEIAYLEGRKAGRGVSPVTTSTSDKLRKP